MSDVPKPRKRRDPNRPGRNKRAPQIRATRVGPKSKLTPALLKKLEANANDYWSIAEAAADLGISSSTYLLWQANARAELAADPNAKSLLQEFMLLTERVGTPVRKRLAWSTLRTIMGDMDAQDSARVTAALGILRLDVAARVELTGKDGDRLHPAPAIDLSKLTTDELVALDRILQKADSGGNGNDSSSTDASSG